VLDARRTRWSFFRNHSITVRHGIDVDVPAGVAQQRRLVYFTFIRHATFKSNDALISPTTSSAPVLHGKERVPRHSVERLVEQHAQLPQRSRSTTGGPRAFVVAVFDLDCQSQGPLASVPTEARPAV
jgi:hypothetical protein